MRDVVDATIERDGDWFIASFGARSERGEPIEAPD